MKSRSWKSAQLRESGKIKWQVCLEGLHPCLLEAESLVEQWVEKPSEQSFYRIKVLFVLMVEKITFRMGMHHLAYCFIDFSAKLMLDSSKYFRKCTEIRDSFVV